LSKTQIIPKKSRIQEVNEEKENKEGQNKNKRKADVDLHRKDTKNIKLSDQFKKEPQEPIRINLRKRKIT